MAIPCPACGREYDVTLFQFGRTITCTCGRRVGLEKRLGPEAVPGEGRPGAPPRFLADVMLGRLARWLRLVGYDAAWEADASDERLVRRALDEGRILLTRDRRLPDEWRVRNVLVVEAEDPLLQLRDVVERLELDWRRDVFTRCSRCNVALKEVDAGELEAAQGTAEAGAGGAGGAVPAGVLERERRFRRCPACDRVYWAGDHTRRMRTRLERVLGASGIG